MNRNDFLSALKIFTENSVSELLLPARAQEEGETPEPRPASVYKMRLPDSQSAKKKAPYIIHQVVTGKDVQPSGQKTESSTNVRSIFCVYCHNEQEGALLLLELMERLRIDLLRTGVLDDRYQLDLEAGVECLIYPEDLAPYFCGEMSTTWRLPAVQREVRKWL